MSDIDNYNNNEPNESNGYDQGEPNGSNSYGQGESYESNSYGQGEPSGANGDFNPNDLNNNGSGKSSKKKKGFGRSIALTIALAVVFGLVASMVFQGINMATGLSKKEPEQTATQQEKVSTTKSTASYSHAGNIAEVANECIPSIVSITNMSVQEVKGFNGWFYDSPQPRSIESTSVGSGIIVAQDSENLFIATNNHVIENADTLTVTFYNNEQHPVNASLKGSDADMDLAVISVKTSDVDPEILKNIKIATLGDSDSVVVGEQAIAIGNALGYGTSVTQGIISATNRKISTSNGSDTYDPFGFYEQTEDTTEVDGSFIQTDAAINPGNSGGALLNSHGEVIGINSAKIVSTDSEGMGYAIPINDAEPIIDELMNSVEREVVSESERGYLGIQCKSIDSSIANLYGIPVGIYIVQVNDKEAAANAGLQKGDVITKVADKVVKDVTDVQNELSYYKAGDQIKITYYRMDSTGEYKEDTVAVTLTEMPK